MQSHAQAGQLVEVESIEGEAEETLSLSSVLSAVEVLLALMKKP